MSKEDRKDRVLTFLVTTRLALPRLALYRNLRFRGADFADSSLKNYLAELREEGYVERIDADAYAEGRVVASNQDPGYWVATSAGADRVADEEQARASDIDTGHL